MPTVCAHVYTGAYTVAYTGIYRHVYQCAYGTVYSVLKQRMETVYESKNDGFF